VSNELGLSLCLASKKVEVKKITFFFFNMNKFFFLNLLQSLIHTSSPTHVVEFGEVQFFLMKFIISDVLSTKA
jgi:hypothetical protein